MADYESTLSPLIEKIDPYRQSFFFFHWSWSGALVAILMTVCAFFFRADAFINGLLSNWLVYLPNYLIHEFSHRIVGSLTFFSAHRFFGGCASPDGWVCYPVASWLTTIAGNGVECLVPALLILWALSMKGGRWLLPFLFYWSATTWYDAAVYVSDARASQLALTSSDMMTNYAPGVVKGDWHYILNPLGLLEYDVVIGYFFFAVAVILLVLAFYSLWYYWTHMDQFIKERSARPSCAYDTSSAQVTAQDYLQDPFAESLSQEKARAALKKEDVNEAYPRGPNDPPL